MSPTELRVRWHRSLRWRLTLSFVVLMAVLLAIAGTIEYSLLRGAVISSRAQTLTANFDDARSVLLRLERSRAAHHRALLPPGTLAKDLVTQLALGRVSALVVGPNLNVIASAAPGTPPRPQVVSGSRVPLASPSVLLAAANFDTRSGPQLVTGPSGLDLVMVFPLATATGQDLGAVELAESAAPLEQELTTASLVLELGSLMVLLLALGSGLWIASRSLHPLQRLTAAASALGAGDLSRRSGILTRADEVGVLAGVFDQMAGSVERTVRAREEAERQMRQFIADASHELRTPLTSIKGYLEVLQRGAISDPEAVEKALATMSHEAERMRRLVADLLTLARADAGRALNIRSLELSSFLGEFLDERTVEVARELIPGQIVLADPDSLFTICQNLQNNAERHGQGREVRWTMLETPDRVGFSCSDTGPGISAEDLPHVFERFYRSGESRSRQDGGSGLGLAIVQSLVERLAGQVEVASGPGEGCRFTVWLPRPRVSDWEAGDTGANSRFNPVSPPAS